VSELEALWLGVVQGVTEFLPVSSSGHLAALQEIFGTGGEGDLLFEVSLHVASLGAILLVYRRRLVELLRGALRGERASLRYGGKLAVATLPVVVFTLLARDWIEAQFATPEVVGTCLLVTSGILWTTRWTLPRAAGEEPGWGAALLIGLAQAFAVLPGISRSGATVATALALGVAPVAAAEFSFLLGVVAILGAAALLLGDLGAVPSGLWVSIAIGSAAALVSGVAAIWLFLRFLERRSFHLFAYYTAAAGIGFLLFLGLR
jgi:undecaprenyl-diphosphatase